MSTSGPLPRRTAASDVITPSAPHEGVSSSTCHEPVTPTPSHATAAATTAIISPQPRFQRSH
jgi:hypothetical protein